MSAPSTDTVVRTARGGPLGRLRDRSLRTKMLTAIGALALVSVVVAGTAFAGMAKLSDATERLVKLQNGIVADRATVHQDQLKARMLIAQTAAATSPDQKKKWSDQIPENDAEIDEAVARIAAADGSKVMPSWDAFLSGFEQWKSFRDSVLLPAATKGENEAYSRAAIDQPELLISTYLDSLDRATEDLNAFAAHEAGAGPQRGGQRAPDDRGRPRRRAGCRSGHRHRGHDRFGPFDPQGAGDLDGDGGGRPDGAGGRLGCG